MFELKKNIPKRFVPTPLNQKMKAAILFSNNFIIQYYHRFLHYKLLSYKFVVWYKSLRTSNKTKHIKFV